MGFLAEIRDAGGVRGDGGQLARAGDGSLCGWPRPIAAILRSHPRPPWIFNKNLEDYFAASEII